MFEDLQQQLIALLTSGLTGESVYGAVPQDAAVPRVVVGEAEADSQDTDTSIGALVKVRVRIIRKAGDVAGGLEVLDRIRAILHHTEALTLAAATVVSVYIPTSSGDPPADDGKTRETEVSVAVLVDDITPGTD